jgi:hypothetical protein
LVGKTAAEMVAMLRAAVDELRGAVADLLERDALK